MKPTHRISSRGPTHLGISLGVYFLEESCLELCGPCLYQRVRSLECVCCVVFSSHPFWTSSSLDVPAGVTQEEGHTGFLIHLPSAVRALIFVARRIQPFLSLVDREVEFLCTNELIVLHPLGIFILVF